MSLRFCRRAASSATVLIVLLARYCPSCAFLTTSSRSNLALLSVRFQRGSRQGSCRVVLASSSSPPSPPERPLTSPPPPKSTRAAAAVSKKSARATPASSTATPLTFGGRVRSKVEVEGPSSAPSTSAEGLPAGNIGKEKEKEEDVRKSARWGGRPPSPPKLGAGLMVNPLEVAGPSLRAIGRGATAAKDALYDAADGISAASSLSNEMIQQQRDELSEGPTGGSTGSVDSKGGALRAVGGGAVIAKDALWSTLDLLWDAAYALGKAPDTARSVAEGGSATLQAAKANVEAVARAPGAAVEVASNVVGSFARVTGAVKDSAYGVADAMTRLASLPGEVAERWRLEQQERERIEVEREAERKENARKFASTVSGTKDLVWGTVDGVGTLVDTVVSAPAAVSDGLGKAGEGLGKAQDTVVSARELLGSIPRTVQEIPLQAQRKVDGVLASVESAQDAGEALASAVGGTIDGASKLVKKGVAIATGEDRREREERERMAEEERRREKERNAVLTIQGEPYTAQDLAGVALKTVGTAARGALGVGNGLVTVASAVPSAPAKVARVVLGPLYEYQQSRKRVRDAMQQETSWQPLTQTTSSSNNMPATSATEIATTPSTASVPLGGDDTSASGNQNDGLVEGVTSVMEGDVQGGDAATVAGVEGRKARRSWDKFGAGKK